MPTADIDRLRQDIVFAETLKGRAFTFHATWGLFNPKRLDPGSRLLIDYLEPQQGAEMPVGLRRLGVVLISMGVVSLALAVAEHWNRLRKMRALGLPLQSHVSLPVAAAGALIAIGGATLAALTTG